ncbi:sterol desaturase/sphingolipid hydroxylase (fatty acid hydroxylase superfamily) [Bradyrhizobium sp. USDA 4341]
MDETLYGARDKRGNWTPNKRPKRAPVFVWPVQPTQFLRWLFGCPGYLVPWQAFFLAISLLAWTYLTPSLETMRDFAAGWILLILLRNVALALMVYGGLHLVLYVRRRQQFDFKYNAKWPDTDGPTFMFGSQTAENVFRTMCIAVPIWTACEVFTWWMFARGYIPYVDFKQHPVYFIGLLLLGPMWNSFYFYWVHRLIHLGPLYHLIHKVHHKNVNPGPWSGVSMHPIENLMLFAGVLIYFVIPSHPLHAMCYFMREALGPAKGHCGFHKIVIGDDKSIDTDHYYHYLHHKYFEVNYGGDRLFPFDDWFGTMHDGSPETDEAMYNRMKAKKLARGLSH